jgi:hypothetical protein
MTPPPWWTEADQAELDLFIAEFVNTAWTHRERCPRCSAGGPWCDPLRRALQDVVDWRWLRALQGRAAYLRARQDFEQVA